MDSGQIKKIAKSFGVDICGIANIAGFKDAPPGFKPNDILIDCHSVIVYGKAFSKSVFEATTNAPYTFMRNKLAEVIDTISVNLSIVLEGNGFKAIPIPSSEPYDYWDSKKRHGRAILSLKHAAQLAGLGSIGKNTLLINPEFGNRLWLGAIITDIQLEIDKQTPSLCIINCNKCIAACPQNALDTITIDQKKCRDISTSSTEGGGYVYACNACRKVCPFSKK